MKFTDRRIYNKFKKLLDNKYEIKKLNDISQHDIGLIRILLSVNSNMATYLSFKEKYEQGRNYIICHLKNSLVYDECFNTLLDNEVIELK
jgi:hypothetical protein